MAYYTYDIFATSKTPIYSRVLKAVFMFPFILLSLRQQGPVCKTWTYWGKSRKSPQPINCMRHVEEKWPHQTVNYILNYCKSCNTKTIKKCQSKKGVAATWKIHCLSKSERKCWGGTYWQWAYNLNTKRSCTVLLVPPMGAAGPCIWFLNTSVIRMSISGFQRGFRMF